mmetsp:Transcript_23409/g.69542  ORF Transcript_23409/g.69542 Transcript_23409/m.69542 type:complete len:373 (+) Transcript_23409:997-2115(+)
MGHVALRACTPCSARHASCGRLGCFGAVAAACWRRSCRSRPCCTAISAGASSSVTSGGTATPAALCSSASANAACSRTMSSSSSDDAGSHCDSFSRAASRSAAAAASGSSVPAPASVPAMRWRRSGSVPSAPSGRGCVSSRNAFHTSETDGRPSTASGPPDALKPPRCFGVLAASCTLLRMAAARRASPAMKRNAAPVHAASSAADAAATDTTAPAAAATVADPSSADATAADQRVERFARLPGRAAGRANGRRMLPPRAHTRPSHTTAAAAAKAVPMVIGTRGSVVGASASGLLCWLPVTASSVAPYRCSCCPGGCSLCSMTWSVNSSTSSMHTTGACRSAGEAPTKHAAPCMTLAIRSKCSLLAPSRRTG